MIEASVVTHAAATLVMVGEIWFVQVVHYPLMAKVSASEFAAYERECQNRPTFVVALTTLIEAVGAALLVVVVPPGLGRILPVVRITLWTIVWMSAVLIQTTLHA